MVKQLILIWAAAVVAFFALWAVAVWLFRKISEKKEKQKNESLNL